MRDGPTRAPGDAAQRFSLSPRRLAQAATRRPGRVLAVWGALVVLGLLLVGGLLPSAITSEGDTTDTPESKEAKQLIDVRLPNPDPTDEVLIVRSEQLTVDEPAFAAGVRALVEQVRRSGSVQRIGSYLAPGGDSLVSQDRQATILPVVLSEKPEDTIKDLIPAVQSADGRSGLSVDITGQYSAGEDFGEVSESDLRQGELQFGLPAALIVLLLVFGTLVGALIPLVMALISIVVGLGLVALIGQVFVLNLFITNMLVAMGLALGIDYSLFIVSRLREERHRGASTREAILTVASTASRAVVFSGIAFSLSMLAMLLMPDTVLRSLAVGAIVVGLVSIAVALTFHPALLMVLGDRVDRLRIPFLGERIAGSAGRVGRFWGGAVRAVLRRPALSLVLSVALLLAAASPLLGLKLGASGAGSLPDSALAKQGLIALERDFPAGAGQPADVVVDGDPADPEVREGIARLRARLSGDRDYGAASATLRTGAEVSVLSVPLTAEASSPDASAAVDRLRDEYVPASFPRTADAVKVGGIPAESRDYFALVGGFLPVVIAVVLALSFVLLLLAFRSIVVPATAIVVNLLSVAAAYGLLVLVFQEGVGADLLGFEQVERIDAWVPVFLFSVLFGLSMDYQVFLLSRINERYRLTGSTHDGLVHGVGSTARLITGAAAIIVVVFAGFATGELAAFQQMGFGVAVALIVDATIVRLVIIPAIMGLLDRSNWYLPTWLEWLPDVRLEGAAEDQPRAAEEAAGPPRAGAPR